MNRKINISKLEAKAQPAPEANNRDRAPDPESEATAQAEIERLVERIVARQLSRLWQKDDAPSAPVGAEGEPPADAGERLNCAADAAKEREDALARREEELGRRELRAWAADEMRARGLPGELAEVVDLSDTQRCAEAVDALEKAFRQAVQRGVDERIGRGCALPRSTGDASAGMTRRMRAAAGLRCD